MDCIDKLFGRFLMAALSEIRCNYLLKTFLGLCLEVGVPISSEKTEWATVVIVFLSVLLDGKGHLLAVPEEKKLKALYSLNGLLNRKRATVKELQSLACLLNFLN